MEVKLQPLADRVVVRPIEKEEVTKGGIVLPDTVKERPQEGKVIAIGPGRMSEDGKRIALDVKVGDIWLKREAVYDIAAELDIDSVPVVGVWSLAEAIDYIKAGVESTFGEFLSEGIVGRPLVHMFDRMGQRVITKIKHRDFGVS